MNESKTNNDNVNCNKGFMTNKGNYANTPEYFKSRALTNSLPKLYNEGDDITERNVFTNCEMTKKELCKIQMKHAHTLEHAKQTRGELNNQWDELEQKEQEFKDSFIYFDNFVNENEMKRIRAHSKLVEMAALTEKRNHDIHYLQHNIRDCEQIKAQMDNTIAELRIFENFLNIVLDKYQHIFNNTTDIIKRYVSLIEAKKCVAAYYEESLQALENSKKHSKDLSTDYYIKISGLRTKLAELYRRHEKAKAKSEKWELILNEITLEAMDKVMEMVSVKDICWKMYKDMCERKNLPTVHDNDYEKQFDFIKKMLYQYECVNKMVKKMEEDRLKMSENACVSTEIGSKDPMKK